MKKVNIIGIGLGNPKTISILGKEIIEASDFIIGAKRMVEAFPGIDFACSILPSGILDEIEKRHDGENISVLMSGDIGFYSGAKKLNMELKKLDNIKVNLVPGISSVQYFSAKVAQSWDDAKLVSMHGREGNALGEILNHRKVFCLLSKDNSPDSICRELVKIGLGNLEVFVGERLSYEDERITSGIASDIATKKFDSLSVMIVINDNYFQKDIITHGISDDEFIRGKVPMTKEEIRSISISKLELKSTDIIYDVGAGTGSVSLEVAMVARKGFVYAIETKEEAVDLILENKKKFGLQNIQVVSGMAPEAMEELPIPDKVFIGGTRGNMEEIIASIKSKNENAIIVLNAIAIESIGSAIEIFKRLEYETEIVMVNISKAKKVSKYNMMIGQNPIYIIKAFKK